MEAEKETQLVDLEADIEEFRQLLKNHATRANVKKVLEGWIEKCEQEKKHMAKILETQYPKKIEDQKTAESAEPVDVALKAIDKMVYEPLNKFGWDQKDKQVKIYVTSGIDGVGSLPKGQVVCEFEDQSFDLKVQDLDGKNYRLRIPETQEALDVGKCKFNVKSNGITVTLIKQDPSKHWTDLKPKKSLVSKDQNAAAKSKNPQGDLMEMMKEMY